MSVSHLNIHLPNSMLTIRKSFQKSIQPFGDWMIVVIISKQSFVYNPLADKKKLDNLYLIIYKKTTFNSQKCYCDFNA